MTPDIKESILISDDEESVKEEHEHKDILKGFKPIVISDDDEEEEVVKDSIEKTVRVKKRKFIEDSSSSSSARQKILRKWSSTEVEVLEDDFRAEHKIKTSSLNDDAHVKSIKEVSYSDTKDSTSKPKEDSFKFAKAFSGKRNQIDDSNKSFKIPKKSVILLSLEEVEEVGNSAEHSGDTTKTFGFYEDRQASSNCFSNSKSKHRVPKKKAGSSSSKIVAEEAIHPLVDLEGDDTEKRLKWVGVGHNKAKTSDEEKERQFRLKISSKHRRGKRKEQYKKYKKELEKKKVELIELKRNKWSGKQRYMSQKTADKAIGRDVRKKAESVMRRGRERDFYKNRGQDTLTGQNTQTQKTGPKTKQDRPKSVKVLEQEGLAAGLARKLEPSNRGFAMMMRMGYCQGAGLGRQGGGMTEPVGIQVGGLELG